MYNSDEISVVGSRVRCRGKLLMVEEFENEKLRIFSRNWWFA